MFFIKNIISILAVLKILIMAPFAPDDITLDLVIDQLIEATNKSNSFMWEMNDITNCVDYLHVSKIDKNKSINFRAYKYKGREKCYLNIYLKESNVYTSVLSTDEYTGILKLINTIENSNTFYNKLAL